MNLGLPLLFVFGLLPWPDLTAGIESIKVAIDNHCGHSMKGKHKVTKADRGVAVWRVESECSAAQKVLLCPYPTTHPLVCGSDPAGATIGTPFMVMGSTNNKKERVSIVCTVMPWPSQQQNYEIKLFTGTATANLTCPTIKPEDHELMLEVVP